ncbi:MAG TPA: hypothetical protein VLJ68_12890 [Chitinophagaceae bacterium]|nr:hypothetical protein [Chitinophagaceae bacterium]
MNNNPFARRRFIKSSAFGLIGISSYGFVSGQGTFQSINRSITDDKQLFRYPSMNDTMASTIVGASHVNFDKVKEMLALRPELAVASWDWGFGDWETCIGAASHTGRRDIAELLISYGARPDIFTFTMMGMLKSVQEIIETVPGIQSHPGPHGITLLQHAKNRLGAKDIPAKDTDSINKVIAYLEGLGNADVKPKSLDVSDEEKQKYLGEYRFGEGEGEIMVVDINKNSKYLQVGKKGYSGRGLRKVDENTFSPSGCPSVNIIFKMNNDKAVSFSVHEPEPLITATRV